MPVPVDFNTIFGRLRRELSRYQKTAAIDHIDGVVFEIELKDKGKVRLVDLETRARELGVMEDIECRGGDWAAEPR